MVASKYAKSTLIYTTQQTRKKRRRKKQVWLSADINSCPTNCTFSKFYLNEGQYGYQSGFET